MVKKSTNFLFICSDQEVSHLDLPADLELPAHERLKAKGTTFSDYYVTTAPCTPSRSVIYTGQHTSATGVITNADSPGSQDLPTDMPTLGHMLRDQGYYTAYKGKWHIGGARLPETPHPWLPPSARDALEIYGFSDYSEGGDKEGLTWEGFLWDRVIGADAARWLHDCGTKLNDATTPWCLAVNFINPHDIMFYMASEGQNDKRFHPEFGSPLKADPPATPYDKFWDLDLPPNFEDDLSDKSWCVRNYQRFWSLMSGGPNPDEIDAWRRLRSYYFNCLRDMDQQLGVVLDALESIGQWDNTVIIYTSDHGEMLGAHGLREKGANVFKENLRVPLIVCHPDVSGGGERDAMGSAIDLIPTILAATGLDEGQRGSRYPDLKGHDLLPALSGAETKRDQTGILIYNSILYGASEADVVVEGIRKLITCDNPSTEGDPPGILPGARGLIRGIHTGRFKFARFFRTGEHHSPTDWHMLTNYNDLELYDLENDPQELVNLAADAETHQDLILDLNRRLNGLIKREIGPDTGREFPGPSEMYQLNIV